MPFKEKKAEVNTDPSIHAGKHEREPRTCSFRTMCEEASAGYSTGTRTQLFLGFFDTLIGILRIWRVRSDYSGPIR